MMSVKITFFNVGQGDSILIEELEGEKTTGVILVDSNSVNGKQPAYEYLKSKGIEKLNAIIISHFDRDHYNGIELFLDNFDILQLYIPPVLSVKSTRFEKVLKEFAKQIVEKGKLTSDHEIRGSRRSFASLLRFIKNNIDIVDEILGREATLRIPGMPNIDGVVCLPIPKVKGKINQILDAGNYDIDFFTKNNDSSIAFILDIEGKKIVLSGDSVQSQWDERRRQMRRFDVGALNVDLLKASHHGSKGDNTPKVYEYIFGENMADKNVIVSAGGGKYHPSKECLNLIRTNGLKPFCTNMSKYCYGNVSPLQRENLPSKAREFLRNYPIVKKPVPCQGNITVEFNGGSYNVLREFSTLCIL